MTYMIVLYILYMNTQEIKLVEWNCQRQMNYQTELTVSSEGAALLQTSEGAALL